jgi:DNA helicase-2/ATP-dependent DNA helicase PcrA
MPHKKHTSNTKNTGDTLNDAQHSAVTSTAKALMIVAGAGTGKTKTLTERIALLIKNGISPKKICALTFTNKAAKEMRDRIRTILKEYGNEIVPDGYDDMFIGTFHAFGAQILKKFHTEIGRTGNTIIYDSTDSLHVIKRIIKDLGIERYKPAQIAEKISAIKNGWVKMESLKQSTHTLDKELIDIYIKYEDILRKNNAFDFDDLIEKTVVLLKTHQSICRNIQENIDYVLVDEYQDINGLQFELIKILTGTEASITVVGDDAQTIYTWRGSDIKIFLDFDRHFKDAQTVFLEENYRSNKIILDAAQALIAHNKDQKEKTLRAQKQTGENIVVIESGDENKESIEISQRVHEDLKNNQYKKTIAILYRTNAQSRAIEQALVARGISYIVYGGMKFYDRKEIKDVVAGLRVMYNKNDTVSWQRLETAFTKKRFLQTKKIIEQATTKNPQEAIQIFLEASEYWEYMQKYLKNNKERKENIEELLRFSKEFSDIGIFLEQISLVQTSDNTTTSKNPVQLTTIHAAKGLEFDIVYVIGVEEKIIPHQMSLHTRQQIEEERRLLYVAITRAKEKLTISYWGQPSRFLFEIPKELTDFTSIDYSASSLDDPSDERYISFD